MLLSSLYWRSFAVEDGATPHWKLHHDWSYRGAYPFVALTALLGQGTLGSCRSELSALGAQLYLEAKGLPTRLASEIFKLCVFSFGLGVHRMHPCIPGEGRRVAKAS
jgi:hypothetical protein